MDSCRRTNEPGEQEVEPSTAGASGEFGYHDLERAALAFVLERESWPVFLEWVRSAAQVSTAVEEWLATGSDLAAVRAQWMAHSPDPDIRRQAAVP